jgi:hypothetical protein
MKSILTTSLAVFAAFGLLSTKSEAGERRFTFTYEATTAPKGSIEFEQWVTWKATRGSENVNQFDFRHELEFGLTDHLQLGVYLSDWTVEHTAGKTKADWEDAGSELIWNLSNPTTDFLGSALYGEVRVGDEVFALEGKLLLQKNFGPWVIAYNAVVEAEWEGKDYDEKVGVFEQNLGVSYQVSPHFTVGAELFHGVEFADWGAAGDHALYAGPNASIRYGNWFATTTVLFQTTGIDEEPDVQTRLIFGVHF